MDLALPFFMMYDFLTLQIKIYVAILKAHVTWQCQGISLKGCCHMAMPGHQSE